MKHVLISAILVLCSIALSIPANAQSHQTVLVDNEHVTAYLWHLAPGQKTDVHTHPAHFLYAIEGCSIRVNFVDGEPEEFDIEPGFSAWFDPEPPHWTENTGRVPCKVILIEYKAVPYKKDKKAGK